MSLSAVELVRARIDQGAVSPMMWGVVAIGFLLNVVDGFDVVAMAASASAVAAQWGLSDENKGWVLSAVLVGMAIGAAGLAPLSDRVGRRRVIIAAMGVTGVSMIATGLIPQSLTLLVLVRIASGLGIGVILASSAAISGEFMPQRLRGLAVSIVIMGYPCGALLVGPVAGMVIPSQGWEMVFIYGGVATLALGVVVFLFLPESVEYLTSRPSPDLQRINGILQRLGRARLDLLADGGRQEAATDVGRDRPGVAHLFGDGLRADTLALWVMYFLGFLAIYFLLSWIPLLIEGAGYARAEGLVALTQFNFGAIVGTVIIALVSTRVGLAVPIGLYYAGAALALGVIFVVRPEDIRVLYALIFAAGFLLQGAFTAMYALAAQTYPTAVRATGVGWAAGLGRVGAIVSPIVTGYLVAAGWDMYQLFLLFAVPLVIAAVLVMRFRAGAGSASGSSSGSPMD